MATRKRSDGALHARITVALSPLAAFLPLLFGAGYVNNPAQLSYSILAALWGCLSGLVISPDLDLIGMTYAEWFWMKVPVIGFLLTGLWWMAWTPYAQIMGRGPWPLVHRGLSHWPIAGTLTRLAYLALPVGVACGYNHYLPGLEIWVLAGWWAVGLMCSDLGHWLRDFKGLEI